MEKINEAYRILSDIDKRATYDEERKPKRTYSNYDSDGTNAQENSTSSRAANANQGNVGYTPEKTNNKSNKGCSSCLGTILGWAFWIGIIYLVISHFHLVDKAKNLVNMIGSSSISSVIQSDDDLTSLQPEEVVETYFKYIKKGEDEKADQLFSDDADNNFQTCTVAEYNQVITDLYYGFEKDIPTYPLFEEIRKFNYEIVSTDVNDEEEYAEVNITIENCDVALLFASILEIDSDENELATLSDSQAQKIVRDFITEFKDLCMIDTSATFVLKKNQGSWKIDSISPLKDFSTVIVGQADDLVLILSGEDVDDEEYNDDDDEDYDDYDYDDDEDYDDYDDDDEEYEDEYDLLW
jgi:curved DNA-binding protein CbpA